MDTVWKVLIIIGIVLVAIILISFLYISVIARKDGRVTDPIYAEIALAAQTAGNILKSLKEQERSALCRVSRGFTGIRIEVSSSGEPPIHFDKEIPGRDHSATEVQGLLAYTAENVAHFAGNTFIATNEYGDSYRIERKIHY